MGEQDNGHPPSSSACGSRLPPFAAPHPSGDLLEHDAQGNSSASSSFQTRRDEKSGILMYFTSDADDGNGSVLRLAMLACEAKAPYGPPEHTATMLMKLIVKAKPPSLGVELSIFPVYKSLYPSDWNAHHGFIIPGSMSEAYDEDKEWIAQLQRVVQQELVSSQRKTLGICFGHQIYAHSFASKGKAQLCPAGFQAGSKAWSTTQTSLGNQLFSSASSNVKLLYTHGDMVTSLPSTAVSLGGDGGVVPIVAAAYFGSEQEANEAGESGTVAKPVALTFQAHLEYATSLGSLERILQFAAQNARLSPEEASEIQAHVRQEASTIQRDNIYVMRRTGELLEWW